MREVIEVTAQEALAAILAEWKDPAYEDPDVDGFHAFMEENYKYFCELAKLGKLVYKLQQ